jgi:hypothetical protein
VNDTVLDHVDGPSVAPQPGQMTTVVRFPEQRGRWAWDARGDNRAVRVSAHVPEHVVNLSVWRDDLCVGTVRLQPSEAAALVAGLTEGLAQLTGRSDAAAPQVRALEDRVARLEERLAEPAWRATATRIGRSVRDAVAGRRPRSG